MGFCRTHDIGTIRKNKHDHSICNNPRCKTATALHKAEISFGHSDRYIHMITEERKLEVPPRETLRMSDTFRYMV